MANILGTITLFVLLVAAGLAFQNKNAYQREIDSTSSEKQKLSASENRFETAKTNLEQTIATREEVDGSVVTLTDEEGSQKKTIADIKSQVEAKTSKRDSNKQQLDDIRDKTSKIGDLAELAAKMKSTNTELSELRDSIAAAEAELANATAASNRSLSSVNAMKSRLEDMSSGRSLPSLSTRIRSIYPAYGFVTLPAGDSSGVVMNSTLDVVRGGETIAKLLVTAVERNSASASIMPDTMAEGVTLSVGDRVVPGARPEPKTTTAAN